jgi:hypothetical protein
VRPSLLPLLPAGLLSATYATAAEAEPARVINQRLRWLWPSLLVPFSANLYRVVGWAIVAVAARHDASPGLVLVSHTASSHLKIANSAPQ